MKEYQNVFETLCLTLGVNPMFCSFSPEEAIALTNKPIAADSHTVKMASRKKLVKSGTSPIFGILKYLRKKHEKTLFCFSIGARHYKCKVSYEISDWEAAMSESSIRSIIPHIILTESGVAAKKKKATCQMLVNCHGQITNLLGNESHRIKTPEQYFEIMRICITSALAMEKHDLYRRPSDPNKEQTCTDAST